MRACEYALEGDFGTVPDSIDEQLDSWNELAMRSGADETGQDLSAPDRGDVGLLGNLVSRTSTADMVCG